MMNSQLARGERDSGSSDIPPDFTESLEDFDKQRFASTETALNETPPDTVNSKRGAVCAPQSV
jgi:hypothetical protein